MPCEEIGSNAERRGAKLAMTTKRNLPLAAIYEEIGGQQTRDDQPSPAPNGEDRARDFAQTRTALPDPATISELIELQRQRKFCIVSQSRCNRSCESFIARTLGFSVDLDPAQRKAMFTEAVALRKAVEKGGGQFCSGNLKDHASPAISAIIMSNAVARDSWDRLRDETEKRMQKLAKSLPVASWTASVRGLGWLGLGVIIGETGDLSGYATKERVWKRLGLAVVNGERQQRKSGKEAAAEHGYSPQRRAEIWAIADAMFRAQWRPAREATADKPERQAAIGPYGAVYGARKAHTLTREWTPKHRDNDARRVMTKALVEDLWRVWNGKSPLARGDEVGGTP